MGQFIFQIPEHCPFDKRLASTVHVVGLDGIPGPGRVQFAEGKLTISRNQDESGHVFLSWPVADFGELVLGTGTLPENGPSSPSSSIYWLDVELARGTVNRLRNQLSLWTEGGLQVDTQVLEWTLQATMALGRAIMKGTRGDLPVADSAERAKNAAAAIALATAANFRLAQNFSRQVFPFRLQQTSPGAERAWLGLAVSSAPEPRREPWPSFAVSAASADFAAVDWNTWLATKRNTLSIQQPYVLGPILDASPDGLSGKLRELETFEQRRLALLQQVRQGFSDPGPLPTWVHAVGGLNGMGHRLLNYPQQIQFTVDILQTLEEMLPTTPLMVSFDGPWGERLAWSVGGAHALQIADSLLRRGLRINLLGLDINLDYWPQGSLLRDPIQWIDLIDLWSQLGLPLVLHLRAASGYAREPSQRDASIRAACNEQELCRLLETIIPMLLARPTVRAIVWQQENDNDDRRFPAGGIRSAAHETKLIGTTWQECRARYWSVSRKE